MSALQLQPKLGLDSYKTAWLLLHKLRRAMVDPDRRPLRGMIEIDETNVPFRRKDEPEGGGQGRSPIGKIFMIGAVEVQAGKYTARCRLQRIVNINRESLHAFIREPNAIAIVALCLGVIWKTVAARYRLPAVVISTAILALLLSVYIEVKRLDLRLSSSAMTRAIISGSHCSSTRNWRIPPSHVRMSARRL